MIVKVLGDILLFASKGIIEEYNMMQTLRDGRNKAVNAVKRLKKSITNRWNKYKKKKRSNMKKKRRSYDISKHPRMKKDE